MAKLTAGLNVAQVSDAGMPGISDPGYRVIKLAIERGVKVVPIPGASAVVASAGGQRLAYRQLSVSGLSAGPIRGATHAAGSQCGMRSRPLWSMKRRIALRRR